MSNNKEFKGDGFISRLFYRKQTSATLHDPDLHSGAYPADVKPLVMPAHEVAPHKPLFTIDDNPLNKGAARTDSGGALLLGLQKPEELYAVKPQTGTEVASKAANIVEEGIGGGWDIATSKPVPPLSATGIEIPHADQAAPHVPLG